MRILKHPILPLWCREDGAICMPPCRKFPKFRWTFGCPDKRGYLQIRFRGKQYRVHRLICQTFHGLAPEDNLTVDHINRNKLDNRPENLRFASYSMQNSNKQIVEGSLEKYGVRKSLDKRAYDCAYQRARRANDPEYAEREKARDREWYAKQKALGKRYRRCPDGKHRMLTDEEFNAMFG